MMNEAVGFPKSLAGVFARIDWRRSMVPAALVILAAIVLLFSATLVADVVTRDQWHFLSLIEHFYNGTLTFGEFWNSHSAHVKPGYKLLFLLNGVALGLNIKLEIYVGLIELFAISLLLYRRYRLTFPSTDTPWLSIAGFLTIATVLFSFNQVATFDYGLLALGGYTGTLLTIGSFLLADSAARPGRTLPLCTATGVVVLFDLLGFAGARGPAILLALLIATGLRAWLDTDGRRAEVKSLVAVAIAAVIGESVYWSLLQNPGGGGLGTSITDLLHHPLDIARYLSLGAASSIVHVDALRSQLGVPIGSQIWLGVPVLAATAFALYLYFSRHIWRSTSVPLMLIIYSACFLGESMAARFSTFGIANAASPRYVFDLMPGLIGLLWILFHSAAVASLHRRRAWIAGAAVAMLIAVGCQGLNAWFQYRIAIYQYNANARAAQQVFTGNFKQSWVCPSVTLCTQGREILRKHQLSVFRPGYRFRPQIHRVNPFAYQARHSLHDAYLTITGRT